MKWGRVAIKELVEEDVVGPPVDGAAMGQVGGNLGGDVLVCPDEGARLGGEWLDGSAI